LKCRNHKHSVHVETPKQAAIDMGISDKTVYLHRASLRAKLGVHNDMALRQLALERGLLE
jgi:DNA-binding CsgD family transcriptional regulator